MTDSCATPTRYHAMQGIELTLFPSVLTFFFLFPFRHFLHIKMLYPAEDGHLSQYKQVSM